MLVRKVKNSQTGRVDQVGRSIPTVNTPVWSFLVKVVLCGGQIGRALVHASCNDMYMLRSVTNGSARQLGCSVRRCSGLALPAPVRSTAGGLFGPAGWVSNWGPRIISIVAAPAVMPKPGPLARLVGYAKKEPLRVNLLLATLKTVVADLLVQKYLEEREAVDLRRTGALPLPALFSVQCSVVLWGWAPPWGYP